MLVGITGGVATGKSTVATLFGQRGAAVFSADEAAREIVQPGSPVLGQIADTFGSTFIRADGSLDRAALGRLVFQDAEARSALERITHPAILGRLKQNIAEARANLGSDAVIVVEAPLLYEAGMDGWFDRIIVVASSPEAQIERLRERSGLTEEEAMRRISSQMPLEEKVRRADRTIWNNGTRKDLGLEADRVWNELTTARDNY